MWNEQYAQVNERQIVSYAVSAAMRDIECWIDGIDPNGAKSSAQVEDWSVTEFLQLYKHLAATASFFNYRTRSDLLPGST
jgi:hypothetical protein